MGLVLLFIGIIGMPFVYVIFPIKLLLTLYRLARPIPNTSINKELLALSFIFAGVTIALVVYLYFYLTSEGPGTSGFLVAYVTFFPFVSYIFFEIFRYKAYSVNKTNLDIPDEASNKVDLSKMIEAKEYAHNNNLKLGEVIWRLVKGSLKGRRVKGQWYVVKEQWDIGNKMKISNLNQTNVNTRKAKPQI